MAAAPNKAHSTWRPRNRPSLPVNSSLRAMPKYPTTTRANDNRMIDQGTRWSQAVFIMRTRFFGLPPTEEIASVSLERPAKCLVHRPCRDGFGHGLYGGHAR